MGRNKSKKNKKKKNTEKAAASADNKSNNNSDSNDMAETTIDAGDGEHLHVDPKRIRFQHSRIRPYFSGCGRSVLETLDQIRNGAITANDLPTISVIAGPAAAADNKEKEEWYFSLNNRRLWIFKKCREEGLLQNNRVQVRIKQPKSDAEVKRYTIENCALEAKFMREKGKAQGQQQNLKESNENQQDGKSTCNHDSDDGGQENNSNEARQASEIVKLSSISMHNDDSNDTSSDGEDSDDDEDDNIAHQNPFSLLM